MILILCIFILKHSKVQKHPMMTKKYVVLPSGWLKVHRCTPITGVTEAEKAEKRIKIRRCYTRKNPMPGSSTLSPNTGFILSWEEDHEIGVDATILPWNKLSEIKTLISNRTRFTKLDIFVCFADDCEEPVWLRDKPDTYLPMIDVTGEDDWNVVVN